MGSVGQFSSCIHHTVPTSIKEQPQPECRYVAPIGVGRPEISCYFEGPGPRRRKSRRSQRPTGQDSTALPAVFRAFCNINASVLAVFFVLTLLFNGVSAQERVHPALQKLARRGELLFDHSPRPEMPSRPMLMARDAKTSVSSEVPSASPVLVTATGGGAGPVIAAATAVPTATSLPQPFDTTIGSNFTTGSGCPAFFNNFLGNSLFQTCYPFSLLLQVSTFSMLRSLR
jgi:hypothetical protein